MSPTRWALVPVAALAGLLLQASSAAATIAPAPASPWATPNGRVLAVARVNGVVYIGGKFTKVTDSDGTTVLTRNHLAAVSAADGHVLPWNPSANNVVRALAVSTDGGTIYIGGSFTGLGGHPRSRLAAEAAIDPTSTSTSGTLRAWAPRADGSVYTIAQLGGRVYFGGTFMHVAGRGRPRLAAVSAGTGALAAWHPKANGAVRAVLPAPSGATIFAAGYFDRVDGSAYTHLVALDPASGRLRSGNCHAPSSVLSLAANSSYLFAGDRGGGGHLRSFKLSTCRLRWTVTTDGNVDAVTILGRGSAERVVVGGHFTKVAGQERHRVATVNPVTGHVDQGAGVWHPAAAGSNLGVYAELGYGNDLYFGGDFLEWQTHPGVVAQARLAVFTTTAPADTTAPTVKAPVATIPVGATLTSGKVPLLVRWSASDAGSGTCRFRVQRRFGTNPFQPVPLLLARSTSATASVSPAARAFTFQAEATDCADNTSAFVSSAPVRVTAFQNSSAAIAYRGRWSPVYAPNAFGGSVKRSGASGASATLRFTGRQVAWVASGGAGYGSARVLIDGRSAGIVHLRSTATVRRRVVFARTWQVDGAHTIRIVALGTAGHPLIDVDSLITIR
jgi:trimeric autotransporter adhesin